MSIAEILAQMGGSQKMAQELGLSTQQVQSGAAALLPAILGGFQKKAATGGADLGGLLGQLGGGGLLDNMLSAQPTDTSLGNDVLGQIFGSKDVSRAVANHAASNSGLDPAVLKKMLPMLAMLATGYMAKQGSAGKAGAGGLLGGLMGGLLGGKAGGAAGLASLLGASAAAGKGNPLDEILGKLNAPRN